MKKVLVAAVVALVVSVVVWSFGPCGVDNCGCGCNDGVPCHCASE